MDKWWSTCLANAREKKKEECIFLTQGKHCLEEEN
jgi:hypothetical protein